MKRHICNSKSHSDVLQDIAKKEAAELKIKSKIFEAGMNLGRLCMKSYKLGKPYQDYEIDTFLLKKSGASIGELNHSRKFPAAFRPHVQQEVRKRQHKFLSQPLKQTGHLPPLAGSADKGTYKHRSRHFLGVITVNPGGTHFLEPISCGQPVVTRGSTGLELARSIKDGFDSLKISGELLESLVFDGVYFHCHVLEHLIEIYQLDPDKVNASWDWMHRTGIADKNVTKKECFEWLRSLIDVCHQIFTTFNWGANYEKFREASAAWKLTLKNLANFSETRFANSKRKVFMNILHQLGPIISVLEEQVLAAAKNRSGLEAAISAVREKGDKAKELLGKIFNEDFILLLSGTADIYEIFGVAVQAAQSVHLLPHERLDLFDRTVALMKSMGDTLDHKDCPQPKPGRKCLFAHSHADKKSLQETRTIRGLKIENKSPLRAAGLQVVTRSMHAEKIISMSADIVAKTDEKLKQLVEELSKRLETEVYSVEEKDLIERTRIVLDLPSLALKLNLPGSSVIKVSVTEFPKFLEAVRSIPVKSLAIVPDDELRRQFREYLARLAEMTSSMGSDCLQKVDPKELIKKFFDPSGELFINIEMIMQALAVSSVKVSCESVLESFVSKYECHFDERRNMSEEGANEEFEISINGPNVANCDSVVENAMNSYWSSKGSAWHFYEVSVLEKMKNYDYNSEVLSRIKNTPSHLPYME